MSHIRTDMLLMEILQERKNITGFFDAVFGFLRRNTDFYHIQKEPSDEIGFAKGVRERILFGVLQRYDPDCSLNQLATDENNEDDGSVPPAAIEEIEVATEHIEQFDGSEQMISAISNTNTRNAAFTPSDYKNGALFDNYCWSQTLNEVELHVKLPPELNNAKLLNVSIKPDCICICNKYNNEEIILSGQISNKFKHNDAVWTATEGKLLLSFDKQKPVWWDKLFLTEPEIDARQIDCERYIDELPEESQAAIHKLRVQQLERDNVQNNRNTVNLDGTLEKLKKAWNADGSPFKGQPFDPSVVKFS